MVNLEMAKKFYKDIKFHPTILFFCKALIFHAAPAEYTRMFVFYQQRIKNVSLFY